MQMLKDELSADLPASVEKLSKKLIPSPDMTIAANVCRSSPIHACA